VWETRGRAGLIQISGRRQRRYSPSISASKRAIDIKATPLGSQSPRDNFRVDFRVMDLKTLLANAEGKTLEFKRDLSSPSGALRTVIAFANTAGGTLLIGVEDGTRRVCGVTDPLAMEERLANLLSDGVSPHLLPEIEILPWRTSHVVAVQVFPSPGRPHFIKSAGVEAGSYVRVGSTNRRADAELLEELRRSSLGRSFDEQAVPELDSEDIDFQVASEYFSPVRKLRKPDLQTLRILVPHQGRHVPSVAGVLLFGRDRETRFPDAWIQAGRFAGTDKTRIVDTARIHGPLPQQVEDAVRFVQKHGLHGYDIGSVRRTDSWSLPPVALREAIVNAVVHADYSQRGAPIRLALFDDRVEIENPGLLPPGLTIDDLRRGVSKLRNRVIGRVFHELGLIEQWGSGIQRMTSACRDAGLPEPELEELGNRFRLTLRTERGRLPRLDAIDQAILDALSDGVGLSTQEISRHIERTPRATRTRLGSLVERGLVREVGSGPQDPKRRYFLSIGG
jgi:predicted HTH transcriptional regulator